jgi:hypothetical protein
LVADFSYDSWFKIKKIQQFKLGSTGIFSITVYAEKPLLENACIPGAGSC